jgi:DNA-binding CsgD family transcriptional regulator
LTAQSESEFDLISRAAASTSGQIGVRRIDDAHELHEILESSLSGAREGCSMLPGGPYSMDVMRGSWDSDTAAIHRGVSLRCLYQADATRTPEMLRYLSEFAKAGAQVRVAQRISHRTIFVDRRLVFVAVNADTLRRPYLMISEPALVRNFFGHFAELWRNAHSVGVGPEDSLDEQLMREILEILKTGVTDEVAARQLNVSARTIRRRVAAVLDVLGASSRFEAGVKAAQLGWL